MADLTINRAAKQRLQDSELELASVPRSRAPKYHSNSNTSYNSVDDDRESLLSHDRKTLVDTSVKGLRTAGRVFSTASQLSQTSTVSRERKKKLQGWRFGVSCSAWMAFSVFMLNLILTIYACSKFPVQDGVGTAYVGSCEYVNRWATRIHILINALSSILLGASNYTMQCLCSPTREEIDRAHARGDWMDIGVASVRNLYKIRWTRVTLWWILALSSVPIHLLYNSAVFRTLDSNDYNVALVNDKWLAGGNFTTKQFYPYNYSISNPDSNDIDGYLRSLIAMQQMFATPAWMDHTEFQNLSISDCISAYETSYVSGRDMLVAITEQVNPDDSNYTLFWSNQPSVVISGDVGYDWMCNDADEELDTCDPTSYKQDPSSWTLGGAKVDHCISHLRPSHCKLQFSQGILIVVILMNICKTLVMFVMLYWQKNTTLVTVGDALASFLDRPEDRTRSRCLMAKKDVHRGPLRWKLGGLGNAPDTQPLPVIYDTSSRRRWFEAASKKRWIVTMGICTVTLIAGAVLLAIAATATVSYLPSGQTVYSLGFGAADSRALININLPQGEASGLVAAVLLANLPQAIFSFLYLTYNGLLTCMLLCHEYSKYAMNGRKKPLRVTTSHGQQRSTYHLHLPFSYSLPLIIASGTLHWLISQSIFLVRIDEYSLTGAESSLSGSSSNIGYSCLPILLVLLLGSAMLLTALGLGFRKFASHIPIAGSCSVALAAACHRPKDDVDAAYLSVHWGEVVAEGSEDIGHCCFTTKDVRTMLPGRLYAGASHGASQSTGGYNISADTNDSCSSRRHPR